MANKALPLLVAGGAALLLLGGKKKSKKSSSTSSGMKPEVKKAFDDAGVEYVKSVSAPPSASKPVKIAAEKPGPNDSIAEPSDKDFWRSRQFGLMYIANHTGINCNPGDPDGIPGEGTRTAIKNFQQAMGLEPTGEWTQVTETAMLHMFGQLASEIPESPPEVKAPKEREDLWVDNIYLPFGPNPVALSGDISPAYKNGYPYKRFFDGKEYIWQNAMIFNRPNSKDSVLSVSTLYIEDHMSENWLAERQGKSYYFWSNYSYRLPYGYGDDNNRLKGALKAVRMGLVPKHAMGVSWSEYGHWIEKDDLVKKYIENYKYVLEIVDYVFAKYNANVDVELDQGEVTEEVCSRFGLDCYEKSGVFYVKRPHSSHENLLNLWSGISKVLAASSSKINPRLKFKKIPSNAPRA